MARRRAYTGYRKPRTVGDGRSFGTAATRPRPKSDGPSKSQLNADAALASILELFESGNLPERIAETVIARAENESPSYHWSLGNQLLMLLAGTTDARGFRQWHEVGRHVSKGARAFSILAPIKRHRKERDAGGDEVDVTWVAGFKAIPVFAIESTEGASVEPVDYHPLKMPPLYEVAERLGVSVRYAPSAGRFRGYYSPRDERIMLVTHDAVTWFHELAHKAHRLVLQARGADLKVAQDPAQEIVAETVAAVLCRLYDLDGFVAGCAEYVEHYGGGNPGRAAMKVLSDVQKTLALILDEAGTEAAPAERELAA